VIPNSIPENAKTAVFTLLATIFLTFLFCPLGLAAEASLFAGGEIDTRGQGFSFLGVDLTQKVYKNLSISGRFIPNFLTYRFYSGDELVRATSPGVYGVAGVKLSWGQTTFGLFGGTEYRYTNLSPDVKHTEPRGNTWAGLVQGEFDTWLPSRTNFNVFASFSGTDSFMYERGKIKQQITNLNFKKPNTINIGVEEFYGRNPDFREIGVGPLLEIYHIPKKVSFAVRCGYKHDSTFGNGAYGGLEFYKGF